MYIRSLEAQDWDRIRALERNFRWNPGPDWMGGLAICDEGLPVAIAGAWKRAEAHLLVDHAWKTPEARLKALTLLERDGEHWCRAQGVGEILTWGLEQEPGFRRRLEEMGWMMAPRIMYGRRLVD
jgi:hypothetical protein